MKYNDGTISSQISRILKRGHIQKNLKRYSITPQGSLTFEKFRVSPEGVTVSPNKITRPKGIIGGFTLKLYEYIKRHEGLSTAFISKYFFKNKDYVKQYLYRLKDYGLIINDGGNWYPTSKDR